MIGNEIEFINDPPQEESAVPGVSAKELSDATAKNTGSESIVQQQFAEEVDINNIMRRFMGGFLPVFRSDGVYGDFSDVYDLESALEKVESARAKFMTLPAEVRERFDNDPLKLVSTVQAMSQEEFEELLDPAEVVPPVVNPPAAEQPGG